MNIRFVGIDGLCVNELKQIFSAVKYYDFIKNVEIRKVADFHNTEVLNIYDVTIEIEPDRDDVSIHIFDDFIYIADFCCRHKAFIHIDRTAYERLEII